MDVRLPRPARRAARRLRPPPGGADDLAVVPRLVVADAVRVVDGGRPRQLPRPVRRRPGRARVPQRLPQHRRLRRQLDHPHRPAVARLRPAHPPRRRPRQRGAARHPLLDLHGADDRRRPRLVEAVLADRGPAQPGARMGRPRPAAVAVVAGHGAALARHPQRVAAGRLLHRADGRRADADPRRRLRGRRHRRGHRAAPAVADHPAAAAPHDAVRRRHRPDQRRAGVRAGGGDHPGRAGRVDEHADLPHPPRRHRAHPGRARLGDGRDAAARPRRLPSASSSPCCAGTSRNEQPVLEADVRRRPRHRLLHRRRLPARVDGADQPEDAAGDDQVAAGVVPRRPVARRLPRGHRRHRRAPLDAQLRSSSPGSRRWASSPPA